MSLTLGYSVTVRVLATTTEISIRDGLLVHQYSVEPEGISFHSQDEEGERIGPWHFLPVPRAASDALIKALTRAAGSAA